MTRFQFDLKKVGKLIILALLIFSILAYSAVLVTAGVERISISQRACSFVEARYHFAVSMAIFDTFITILLPFLIILTLNLLIVYKLCQKMDMTRNLDDLQESQSNILMMNRNLVARTVSNENENAKRQSLTPQTNARLRVSQEVQSKRRREYTRTMMLLFVLLTAFLIFHTPITIKKIYYVTNYFISPVSHEFDNRGAFYSNRTVNATNSNVTSNMDANLNEEILERFASYIFYLDFPLNVFFYSLNSSKCRNIVLRR
jgi:hypothetical protein